jgi:outer membrane protein OmpA-like peptidoglycan-associated protein
MSAPNPPYPPYPPYPPFSPYPPYAPFALVPAFHPPHGGVDADHGLQAPIAGPIVAATAAPAPLGAPPLAPSPSPAAAPVAEPQTPSPALPRQFPGSSATTPLTIYFNYDRFDIVDTTAEGVGQAQFARLNEFVANASAARAASIRINGLASPEGSVAYNRALATSRAQALVGYLQPRLPSVPIQIGTTGEVPGPQDAWPQLRRADVFITSLA